MSPNPTAKKNPITIISIKRNPVSHITALQAVEHPPITAKLITKTPKIFKAMSKQPILSPYSTSKPAA